MLFTTIPLGRSQSTSQVLLDHNVQNEAPASISDVRISVISTFYNAIVAWYYHLLWMVVSVYNTEKPLAVGKTMNIMGARLSTGLFRIPPLVVSFATRLSEASEEKLRAMNFIGQSKGSYKYYKGTATEENMTELIKLSAQADAYAEYGTMNVNGFLAYLAIDNLISCLLSRMGNPEDSSTSLKKQRDIEKTVAFSSEWVGPSYITSSDTLPEGKGTLFPFFNGLVLPDKAAPIKFILNHFNRCYGNNPTEVARNCAILADGWTSLSTSPAGCAISHLLFGIELALSAHAGIRAVYLNGEYSGFVIFGKGFAFLKGKTLVKLSEHEALKDEINSLNKHEESINSICDLLSAITLRKELSDTITRDGVTTSVKVTERSCLPLHIDTPRKLYNQICLRKIEPAHCKQIQAFVLKLEYKQTFWSTSDQGRIAQATRLICSKTPMDEKEPFAYKTSALYSLDNVSSVLAAFGPVAPSLTGQQDGNGVIMLTPSGKMYEGTKGFSLHGAPVFVKSLQQAVENWNAVLDQGLIRFKHAGNDKAGRAKISGRYTIVPKGSSPYETMTSALGSVAKAKVEQTRKRKAEDTPEDPKKEEERASKKGKKDNELLAMIAEPQAPMDVDTVEDF